MFYKKLLLNNIQRTLMKKLILMMAILAPMIAHSEGDPATEFTKVKEFSDRTSAMVLGYCAGLHLKTSDEQVDCINNGFNTVLKVVENARIESSATPQSN
mgnify:FL=1